MVNRIFLLGLILIFISSCNRGARKDVDIVEVPFIINCDKLIHQPEQGLDSKVGTIICNDIKLLYDYGSYSNSKPESMVESFSKSFYAYHYSKFFDAIFVDEKLRESLKDSVRIVKVTREMLDEKYIVNCNDCNATAYLKFNETDFFYPFIMNDLITKNHMIFDISLVEIKDYYKKIYLAREDQNSGVFIAPLGNPRKNRKFKKLSVITEHKPDTQLKNILGSIRLK